MKSEFSGDDELQFMKALQAEDEIGLVIRSHIYVEACLNQFIDELVVSSKHVEKMNLDYSQRVGLAIALGLSPKFESALLALGSLRYAFAHKPHTKLSKDRIDNLYKCLSSNERSLVQESDQKARRKPGNEAIQKFSQAPPRHRFILIAITLRAMLIIGIHQARSESDA